LVWSIPVSTTSHGDPLDVFDALYSAACDDRDAAAVHALWATDPDTVMWGSDEDERAHGPEEVKALLEAVVASPSELGFDWEEREHHVEGDVCWINARGSLYVNGEATPYRVTAVLVRRDGVWRWHTHSGSEPN
jgi:ketosteroid isomerase-like protein